jgi:hypothetical protein
MTKTRGRHGVELPEPRVTRMESHGGEKSIGPGSGRDSGRHPGKTSREKLTSLSAPAREGRGIDGEVRALHQMRVVGVTRAIDF